MWENPGLAVGAPPRCEKGVKPGHLRTRGGCSYGSRRIPVLMWENPDLAVGAPPSVRQGSRARTPSHPGRVRLRFEENPGFDVGEPRFGCRSTALGAKRVSSQSTFAPGAGAPTVRGEPPVLSRRIPVLVVLLR